MMLKFFLCGVFAVCYCVPIGLLGIEPPENYALVLEDSFGYPDGKLPKGWTIQNGTWVPTDGVLEAREVKADKHAASARKILETTIAIFEVKFRLTEGTRGFHLGFDPKRGSLKKKGHLFSVMVLPNQWRIMKHLDKNRPKEDPNEILAKEMTDFEIGKWYTLRVATSGNSVAAEIVGQDTLTCSHPSFDVPKPTIVFRAIANGADLDDLKVWAPKE